MQADGIFDKYAEASADTIGPEGGCYEGGARVLQRSMSVNTGMMRPTAFTQASSASAQTWAWTHQISG